jgi:spore maturation protein CgeB
MKILFAAPITFNRITFFISQYTIGLARAALSLGHEVKVIQTTENMYNPYLWDFLMKEFNILRSLIKPVVDFPHDILLFNQIIREIESFKPDLLFIHLIDTSYLPFFFNKIRGQGVRTFTWLGIKPSKVSSGILRLLRTCDYVFIYDPDYIEYYNNYLKINNVHVVPLGCDVSYFDSVRTEENSQMQYGVDVSFVGLFDKHREKYLKALSGFNLGIWSWNIYDYKSPLIEFHKGIVYGKSMIEVFKSSKIVLNIHRDFEKSGGNYRLFEIPAAGAFQIVDEKKNIGNYFKIGEEIVTFRDENDLRRKVKYYLEHPDEREKIARAGYERVKRDHSLVDRLQKMLGIIYAHDTVSKNVVR